MKELDEFTRAYVECAFWTMDEDNDNTQEDIAPHALGQIIRDCAIFQHAYADEIGDNPEQAGHDFWLTRNGHGAGFWDGDWPEHGDHLTEACKLFGECDLYFGDDGKLYVT